MKKRIIFICLWVSCLKNVVSDQLRTGYGNSWLLFFDEQWNTYVMNFSVLPGRGILFGRPIFHLYTRSNPYESELLTIPAKNSYFNSTYLNKSNQINVITHGWMASDQTDWVQRVKDTILWHNDVNVITVDWGGLAKNPIYPYSALSTRYVGKQIAKLLDACTISFGVPRNSMHLIGHSLGAQVMGYAGMFMNSEVRRITGLDPARPMFELPLMPDDFRLDKSDALFVDIIHTCGGLFGYLYSHGHADYFPNEGKSVQPGCDGDQLLLDNCSHGRSTVYFEESVDYMNGRGFISRSCDSWKDFTKNLCNNNKTSMGYYTDTSLMGEFYLYTNSAYRYAIDNATL